MARIVIPKNPDEVLNLINNIIKKEEELGPNGELTPTQLSELKAYYTTALASRTLQESLYKDAEEETKVYENTLGTKAKVNQPGNAKFIYTGLRDILAGKNKTNLKKLGDWGYDVVDEPAPKKPKKD